MKTTTRQIHQCEHCRKVYLRKDFAQQHETRCKKNPSNFRPCFGCIFIEKRAAVVSVDTPVGEAKYDIDVLFCRKIGDALAPPSLVHRNENFPPIVSIDGKEVGNYSMPTECELAEYYGTEF